ncbi:MAG TPA: SAM-dependent methyltransferase [Gammaproteobacteria bacterium]|jgi:SAM-dependent MidA family methyltransferase|nr:SAM-dependent methyltransferase [Gammaproteobacteria bacterium]
MTLYKPEDHEQVSDQLLQLIRQEIEKADGALPFDVYMEHALYHPLFGYYNAPTFTLGEQGDFTTAPEISPVFARCLVNPCIAVLSKTGGNLLELGAGTGVLAKDLLTALAEADCLPDYYFIYEISPTLRQKQQAFLQIHCHQFFSRIVWLDKLPAAFHGVIIANEVCDALPVHCFTINNGEPAERCVIWHQDHFAWENKPATSALKDRIQALHRTYALPEGFSSEINFHLDRLMSTLAACLTTGMLLIADYGYGEAEYYRPDRREGTLTCFYRHQKHHDPLILTGQQDITAHVDFTRLITVASQYGCELLGYTTQAAFLADCGLLDIAATMEKTLSTSAQYALRQALKILTLPTEMGEHIKVMALAKNMSLPIKGFGLIDRRRDL